MFPFPQVAAVIAIIGGATISTIAVSETVVTCMLVEWVELTQCCHISELCRYTGSMSPLSYPQYSRSKKGCSCAFCIPRYGSR